MKLASLGAAAALGLLAAAPAPAADVLKRLSPNEIRARVVGKVITDEAHWSDKLVADGTLVSYQMGNLKPGSWKLDGDELCLTRRERGGATTDCFEVWVAKDQIELRRDGVTVVQAVLRDN